MSPFPPELAGCILSSLDGANLRSCSLVNKEFCMLSQDFLFCHLHVCATLPALVDQCNFFLAEENNHLSSRIRELSIDFDEYPAFHEGDTAISQFTKLLIKLGTQISTLRIEGEFTDYEWDYEISVRWEDLSPTLCHCLYEHILPSLRNLELPGVANVPVFQILRKTPLLRHIHLGSDDGKISPYVVGEIRDVFFHQEVVSLSIGPFEEQDFRPDTELSKFIKYSEGNITTFHLSGTYRPPSLEFLSPFPEFTSHVLRFSIGQEMFHRAILSTSPDPLNLTVFQRLETFSCPITFPYRSSKGFNWIAKSLHSAIVSHQTLTLPLKKLYFPVTPEAASAIEDQNVTNGLDDLAHNAHLSCSIEFSVPISVGREKVQSVFEGLREFFPSWDQMGKLKLWVQY
ncbi:hypothetical protein DL96DRAFT_1810474 [Flagelloscypha sp. PMI_526]|nr:hypothetical protein DL96DRAFT_1810474 [Flagelloscypha sp. PMI_526]